MYHIFEKTFKNQEELEEYIYAAIDDYVRNTKSTIETLNVIEYISILKQYIDTKCPKKERNTLRLISFINSAIDKSESSISSVDLTFANLLLNEPESFLPIKYTLMKGFVNNELIYDTLLFLKFNLLSTITAESNKDNVEEIKQKYADEMKLLDSSITLLENLENEKEEADVRFREGDNSKPVPGELKEKIEKFLDEYKPYAIKAYLDKRIIGQEEAKRTMSVAIYNHMLLLAHPELKLKKNNVLMVGPSGCGKTEIMRVLSEILPVPISIFDTSGISQNGWKGDKKIKDAVKELVLQTNDVEAAECGIVFLDEFDKMCRPTFSSGGDNVSVHIQGEALAMIEGCNIEINLSSDDAMFQSLQLVNTKNILFVCAGAFQGIEDTVRKIKNKNTTIGFGGIQKDVSTAITAKDITKDVIIEFGVTPELAGRLSITTVLNPLTKDDMLKIITECENNVLDEVKNIAKVGYGVELSITKGAIMKLIDDLCMNVGARGIRSVFFEHFTDILYNVSMKPNTGKIVIDKNLVAKYIAAKTNKDVSNIETVDLEADSKNHIDNVKENRRKERKNEN